METGVGLGVTRGAGRFRGANVCLAPGPGKCVGSSLRDDAPIEQERQQQAEQEQDDELSTPLRVAFGKSAEHAFCLVTASGVCCGDLTRRAGGCHREPVISRGQLLSLPDIRQRLNQIQRERGKPGKPLFWLRFCSLQDEQHCARRMVLPGKQTIRSSCPQYRQREFAMQTTTNNDAQGGSAGNPANPVLVLEIGRNQLVGASVSTGVLGFIVGFCLFYFGSNEGVFGSLLLQSAGVGVVVALLTYLRCGLRHRRRIAVDDTGVRIENEKESFNLLWAEIERNSHWVHGDHYWEFSFPNQPRPVVLKGFGLDIAQCKQFSDAISKFKPVIEEEPGLKRILQDAFVH